MPHAAKGRFSQCGLCGVLNHETIDTELTGIVTARVRRERRTATGCLAPATVSSGVVASELGTALVHDTVRGSGGGREEDKCKNEGVFHRASG